MAVGLHGCARLYEVAALTFPCMHEYPSPSLSTVLPVRLRPGCRMQLRDVSGTAGGSGASPGAGNGTDCAGRGVSSVTYYDEGADGEKQEGKAGESLPSLLGRVLVAGMIHPTHAIVFSCALIVLTIM